ncbi:hypothetical protein [Legionella brunensis]|uniref:Uncharacterized protein n=1 Tax=Legionella brunensis TaxID=29422 RepID=A0A0W0SLG9_9GAMM|nr:hypothetical protein [Legionella brunensis]KTC84224.1 hypothetical protein Lbru_1585 [Legionella brunensis]
MKANLTDYISTFAAFDPTFDALKTNPLTKIRQIYQATKIFLASLEKQSTNFPELKEIRTKIADLNDFFADMILEQTNGALKLAEDANLQVAKSRNKFGHVLAKKIIKNPDEFLESIEEFLDAAKKQINQAQQTTLDEKKKLDEVDLTLLTNSMVSLGFQDRFFGGATNINAKTERSNVSLFANRDFQDLASPTVKIEGRDELLNTVAMLQKFVDITYALDNKFGFSSEEPSISYSQTL